MPGLVWSGLVWSGLVWSGLIWSGLVWSSSCKKKIFFVCKKKMTRSDQARPGQARPDQTQQDLMLTLFWPERASYKICEALDTTIRKLVTRSSVLEWSQPIPEGLRGVYKGSKVDFGMGFGRCLADFWMTFGRFFDDFWAMFG